MEKETYFVGVASSQITRQPETTQWEYKIEATEEEIAKLRELFETAKRQNLGIAYNVVSPIQARQKEHDYEHFDHTLQEIYQLIYELGNEEAKEHIDQNNLIAELGKDYS